MLNGGWTVLDPWSVTDDYSTPVSVSANTFTALVAGVYQLNLFAKTSVPINAGASAVSLYVEAVERSRNPIVAGADQAGTSLVVYLEPGKAGYQTFEPKVFAFINAGASVTSQLSIAFLGPHA